MEGITLPPEAKIHMALDDIIRIEKPFVGISHNMYRRKRPQFRKGPQRRFWRRRRFISQNWRLRGNGPKAPKNRMKVINFLERKYATKPLHSVFQRLGYRNLWNNQWEMSRKKLRNARRYQYYRVPPFQQKIDLDPSMQPPTCAPAKPLTTVDFAKLREVLGGQITSVSQKSTDDGSLITTITRLDNTSDSRSEPKFNPSDRNINSNVNMSTNPNFQQLSDSDIINDLNNGQRSLFGVNNTMSSIAQNQFGLVSRQQAAENRVFKHNMNRAYANASASVINSQNGSNMDFSGINDGASSLMAHNMQNSGIDRVHPLANNMDFRSMNANIAAANLPMWMNTNGRMNGLNLANFNMNKNIFSAIQQDDLPPHSSANFSITPHSAGLIQNRFTNGPDISFD